MVRGARVMQEDRNTYVHGLWFVGPLPETAIVQTLRLSRAHRIISLLVTRADLDQLISEIETINSELYKIALKLDFLRY